MKKTTFVLILFIAFSSLKAQISDLGRFFATGVDDGEKLLESYFSPYMNAFGASMTGGWYNTAKTHQLGGFDITATMNAAFVPSKYHTFNVSQIELQGFDLAPGENPVSPTVAGKQERGPMLNYKNTSFNALRMPEGVDIATVPSPMLQLGVGLIKDTEVMGRFMPPVSISDNRIGMWGIGFKHGVDQWIPVFEKVPVLNISVMYGYTKLFSSLGLSVTPDDINAFDNTTTADWSDQSIEYIAQSHTANILVSADLPIICFYGGIGFASTISSLDIEGDLPMVDMTDLGTVQVTDQSYIPSGEVGFKVKNQDGGITKPRLNVGMRLKFGILTLHGDYTYANYSMATVGMGISFR